MTTLTPSQYEALPEAEKIYWQDSPRPTYEYDGSIHSTQKIIIEYTPVMIQLADVLSNPEWNEKVKAHIISGFIDMDNIDYDVLLSIDKIMDAVFDYLNKLKDLAR